MQIWAQYIIRWLIRLLPGCYLLLCTCNLQQEPESAEFKAARELSLQWNQLLVELERHTPGYRPPVTARTLAYVSAAAWQAALPGIDEGIPIQQYCPGYVQPARPPVPFILPASLNAAYAEIIRQFFPTAPPHLLERIHALEAEHSEALRKQTDPDVIRRSANYGKRTALAVWRWSAADSIGHNGDLFNFDRAYVPPACPGCWQPDGEHPMPALLPNWGTCRTFIVPVGAVEVRPHAPFNAQSGSAYYAEAMEVYSISRPLSRENHWIAELWSDDLPGFTVTPAGRWVAITNQAVEKARLPLPKMLELYLKLGFGLSDAMVTCWNAKYRFNRERPASYINSHIDAGWKPLHESPSFPAYPSGHAALGAVSAELLSHFLGEHFELTDRTHDDRKEFAGEARHYHSFHEMAHENAVSRVALGVHFRTDCEEGLRLGKIIGQRLVALRLQNETISMTR